MAPDFPRYESKKQPTTQAPSAPAPSDQTGAAVMETAKLGTQVQDVVLKYEDAQDTMKFTHYQANLQEGLANIESLQAADQDLDNFEKYDKMAEDLLDNNSKDFSNPATGAKAKSKLQLSMNLSKIRMRNVHHKKEIANWEYDMTRSFNYIIQSDMMTYGAKTEAIASLLEDGVASNLTTRENAQKLYKDNIRTIVEYDVANDLSVEEWQSAVLAELKKGDQGSYKDIPPDERLSLIKASQQRVFNNNQTYKRDTADASMMRENALLEKFSSQTATINDIEAEESIPEASGGIKRKRLLQYKKAVISGIKGDLDRMLKEKTDFGKSTKRAVQVEKYLELIEATIDDGVTQEKVKELLADAWADGRVQGEEGKLLNDIKQNMKEINSINNPNPIVYAIRGVMEFFNGQSDTNDEDLVRNIKTLLSDVSKGVDPIVASRNVLTREMIRRFPDIASYPETGVIKRDPYGNKARLYPDGTYEEIGYEEIGSE